MSEVARVPGGGVRSGHPGVSRWLPRWTVVFPIRGTRVREQALWLGAALGLFLLGVVFPMAILVWAMSDFAGALSPAFVVRSIAAVPGSYAAVVTMMRSFSFSFEASWMP